MVSENIEITIDIQTHAQLDILYVVPSYLNNNSNLKYNTNTMTMAMWLFVFNNVVNDIGLFVGPYVSFPSIISFQAIPFTSTAFIKTMQFIGILKAFDTFCHLSLLIFLIMVIFRIWVMRGRT